MVLTFFFCDRTMQKKNHVLFDDLMIDRRNNKPFSQHQNCWFVLASRSQRSTLNGRCQNFQIHTHFIRIKSKIVPHEKRNSLQIGNIPVTLASISIHCNPIPIPVHVNHVRFPLRTIFAVIYAFLVPNTAKKEKMNKRK